MHHVRAADEHLVGPAEVQDAGVLEEPAQDRPDVDVLAQPRHPGAEGADTPHHDLDGHAGLRRAVQGVDHLLVDQRVGLDADARIDALLRQGDLALDALDDPRADALGGDQQTAVGADVGEPGQVVEQVGQVGDHVLVRGEQPDVLIQARGLGVVVPGADVGVPLQAVALLADHQAGLAVGLEAEQAVDDVDPGLFQLAGPPDVVLLVEAGLDLHQRHHLLAGGRGVHQGVDDGGVAGRAVQRLLDGQHVLVRRGLLDEALHGGGERVVRVLDQGVGLLEGGEDVAGGLPLPEGRRGRGDHRRVLEVRQVQPVELPEAGQVQEPGEPDHVPGLDVQLPLQDPQHPGAGVLGDLQPHRGPEAAAGQLALEGL